MPAHPRFLLFVVILVLMAATAGLIWTISGPQTAELSAEPLAVTLRTLPTLAPAVPTPAVTPGAGQGGLIAVAPDELLPTPTLVPATATAEPTEPPPTATAVPPTASPTPTAEPPTPEPSPTPGIEPPQRPPLNGIPYEAIVVLPDNVIQRAKEIYAGGQAIGRNPRAYAKVGDSTTENPHFLTRFDSGPYNLGPFAHLQPVVDHFLGSHGRDSVAVRVGMHAWTANDPIWADKSVCLANESPVNCEIRLHNPSIILIRLGTNDVGVPSMFDGNIRQIVDTAIANGVIPVIGTKGDRHEGSNENNEILRRVAADYQIPLWDYDVVAGTLPGRGLDVDAAHMLTFFAHDYNDPTAYTRGHAMHNLTALMMLDAIWREVMQGGR